MIETIPEFPDGVPGFKTSVKVKVDDYEFVLVPAVEDMLRRHRKISLRYQPGNDFTGYDTEAIRDDTKIGLEHLFSREKITVVADIDWVRGGVRAFGFVVPCDVKLFANDELGEVRDWVID